MISNISFRKLVFLLALVLLIACQSETLTQEPTHSTSPTPGSFSGINGEVLYESDVATQPDQPLVDQLVLVIPLKEASRILGINPDELNQETLRFLRSTITTNESQIITKLTDNEGKYIMELPPGEYVICLGDAESPPEGFPVNTRGCGQVAVAAGALVQVNISSGFGEILLENP